MPIIYSTESELEVKIKEESIESLEKVFDTFESVFGLSVQKALVDATVKLTPFLRPIIELSQNKEFRNNVATNPVVIAGISTQDARAVAASVAGAVIFELAKLLGKKTIEEFQRNRDLQKIDRSDLKPVKDFQEVIRREANLIKEAETGIRSMSNKEIANIILEVIKERGVEIRFEDVLDQLPDLKRFFDEERIQKINKELENNTTVQDAAEEASKKLNETGIEGNKIKEEQIKLNKDNTQGLLDIGKTQSTVANASKQLTDSIKEQSGELKNGSEIIELTEDDLLSLDVKYAMVDKAANTAADGGLTNFVGKVEDVKTAASDFNLAETIEGLAGFDPNILLPGFLKPIVQSNEEVEKVGDTLEESSERGKAAFEELGLLASNVAAAINDTFSELIFRAFKGDFNNISDLWKSMLNSMLRSFANFAATILTNPIQVTL